MRNLAALALGLMVMGLGIYGAAAVAPLAFPAAFDARGYTTNTLALIVMLASCAASRAPLVETPWFAHPSLEMSMILRRPL